MPAIKELEIKMGKRTEDIKVRLLALEQDNYIMGMDRSTLRDIAILEGWERDRAYLCCQEKVRGILENIKFSEISLLLCIPQYTIVGKLLMGPNCVWQHGCLNHKKIT